MNIIWRFGRDIARRREERKAYIYIFLVGKSEGKRLIVYFGLNERVLLKRISK
jgi:hypothetical protein